MNRTHGKTSTATYMCWKNIKKRCLNPNNRAYPHYGGRGIRICDRWLKFENFYADMGEAPDGLEIDRIDNNGHYEPGNCRWATRKQQNGNARSNRYITFLGHRRFLADWSRITGLTYRTISGRLMRGWAPERALIVSTGR